MIKMVKYFYKPLSVILLLFILYGILNRTEITTFIFMLLLLNSAYLESRIDSLQKELKAVHIKN